MARRQGKQAAANAVGVIGLGIMGSAMSANLVKAGFAVFGYDPVDKARRGSPRPVARPARASPRSLETRACWCCPCPAKRRWTRCARSCARARVKGVIAAETSTLPEAAKMRAFDRLAQAKVTLLDCPLSGTGAQAVNRDLSVYASGDAAAIESFAPVFEGFARARYDVGAFGNGTRMKLVANLLVAIHNLSTAEAILMGARSGLDPAMVVKVVADGAGGSRMFQVRGPVMVDRSWDQATMKVSTWQKDMRLINDALQKTDTPAPLFAACMPIYNAAMALGHGGDDTAAVYSVLEHMMGTAPAEKKQRESKRR